MRRLVLLIACCFFLLSESSYADVEDDVIDLVNTERAAVGLHPLNYDARLATAARDHSEDMGWQDYFSHTSLDDRSPADRVMAAGYSYNRLGENIAAGQPTPESVVDAWMSSPGHRANILNPDFCDIGVGYAYVADSTYGHYWTQDFGRQSGVSSCPDIDTFTITATAGTGGSISPEGNVSVDQGQDKAFSIVADPGFAVDEVLVDDESEAIVTSYTFSNVTGDHTIEVSFELNSFPPTADAGPSQNVLEGETVTLDGSLSSDANDAVVAYEWVQISGPDMVLSDETAAKPTFIVAPIAEDATLVFELSVYDSGDSSDSTRVEITVAENGDIDLAGPGVDPSTSGETGSSGGSGGCFIDTAAGGSKLQNYLRWFRNRY